jgi:hypothetical protein
MMADPPHPAGVALGRALADELVLASQLLADLAYELGSDETTLRRHLSSLQKLDRVTQMQLAVAELLRGDVGIDAITLEDMKQRIGVQIGQSSCH